MFLMRYVSHLLLFGLLLTITACAKKKDPEPQLEGIWTVQYTETTQFNADGSVQDSYTINPSEPTTFTFTAAELTVLFDNRLNAYTYTRDQTSLHCRHTTSSSGLDFHITTLAKSELILEQATACYPGVSACTRAVIHLTR